MDKLIFDQEYPFASNFLKIGNHNLHYIDVGEAQHTIVMVHGNPTWSFYYRNLIKKLSKNYRVIAIDHLGCGLSDKPQDYDYCLENHIANLNILLRFLDITNYDLIVHDWGGAIGLGNAVINNMPPEKLILLNTAAFTSDYIPKRINLLKLPIIGPFMIKACNLFCLPATFMTTVRPLSKKVKKAYLHPYQNIRNRVAINAFVQDIPMSSKHRTYSLLKEIEDGLKKINGPKMILWGGKDFCFNDYFFTRWDEIYPDAQKVYFKDAGHYVLEDKNEECSQHILEFVNQ